MVFFYRHKRLSVGKNNYFLVFSVSSPLVASFLLYLFLRVSIRIIL